MWGVNGLCFIFAGKHVVFGKLADMGMSFAVVKKMEKLGSRPGTVSKTVIIRDCGEIIK